MIRFFGGRPLNYQFLKIIIGGGFTFNKRGFWTEARK